jgi:hypothetical protein
MSVGGACEQEMNTIAEKIYRMIRERSLGTELSSLKQRGVKRVSVFKSNQLGDLVAMAVEQVLDEFGVKLSRGELEGLSAEGRAAFLKVLEERDAYKSVVEKLQQEQETLRLHKDVLLGQIEREGSLLEDEREFWKGEPLTDDPEAFRDRIRGVLDRSLQRQIDRLGPDPDPRVVKFICDLVEGIGKDLDSASMEAMRELRERYRSEGERRIRTLERRIEKLRDSLRRAEDALVRLDEEGVPDDGIASIYKTVQGLSPAEQNYDQKKKMLEEIFQLNVKIREEIG